MMKNMSSALEYAEDSLKADPEVVKIAVAQEGCALEYAEADPETVRIAVAKNGLALRYAAEDCCGQGWLGTGTCSRVTEGRPRGGEDCCGP